MTLASHRHGHSTLSAKGSDLLPTAITAPLERALVRSLDRDELVRALQAVSRAALGELWEADADLAARLQQPLLELADLSGL